MLLATALTALSGDAFGYKRVCRWPFAGQDVSIVINQQEFEKFGYDANYVRRQVEWAASEWTVRGGLPNRLVVTGFTTATSPPAGQILVRADEADKPIANEIADALGLCATEIGGGKITFYPRQEVVDRGFSQHSPGGDRSNLPFVMLHELGHILGFDHPDQEEESALMSGYETYELGHDEVDGNRTGTCKYGHQYNAVTRTVLCENCTCTCAGGCTCGTYDATYDCSYTPPSTRLKGLVSNDGGATWTENLAGDFINPDKLSYIDADHAFGYWRTPGSPPTTSPTYVVAYSKLFSARDLYVVHGAGNAWSSEIPLGAQSESGPGITWGGTSAQTGYWVLVHQSRTPYGPDEEVGRPLFVQTAEDPRTTGGWTTPQYVMVDNRPVEGISRPMVAYAPTANKFVLAWVDLGGAVQSLTATPASYPTWELLGWTPSHGIKTMFGGGLACVAGVYASGAERADCLLGYVHSYDANLLYSARAWTDAESLGALRTGPPKPLSSDFALLPPDVAIKAQSGGGAAEVGMAWRSYGAPHEFYFAKKTSTSPNVAWPPGTPPSGGPTGIWTGVSLAYSSHWTEWTAIYAR